MTRGVTHLRLPRQAKDFDIAEIGTRLEGETVLEGSVRPAGHQLRVTARVIDVRHGARL